MTSPSISTFASFSAMAAFRYSDGCGRRSGHSLNYSLLLRGGEDDVGRLGALVALARLVLDLRALGEGLEPVAADAAVVDEEILATILRGDEPVSLAVVEPLNGSACHMKHLLTSLHEQVREAHKRTTDSLLILV